MWERPLSGFCVAIRDVRESGKMPRCLKRPGRCEKKRLPVGVTPFVCKPALVQEYYHNLFYTLKT